ncbi:MAG: BamA/TamA family outer membrane protein, partial [Bdellovibrionales bacterium]|nr:BamA/TamA family outer membrane protein [Bdellovibrionales bacterium]
GFLFVSIHISEDPDDASNRTTYRVEIVEEEKVPVHTVEISKIQSVPLETLEEEFHNEGRQQQFDAIFNPDFAVREQLDRNAQAIGDILILLGFPDAKVTPEIIPNTTGTAVDIRYGVQVGDRLYAEELKIVGAPPSVTLPDPPLAPYSIPKANRYIAATIASLRDEGFLNTEIWTELSGSRMILHIEPGIQESIANIDVIGNSVLNNSLVLSKSGLAIGDKWTTRTITEAKRKLLRLGIFSRVSIIRTEREVGKSDVIIQLEERPLQTLEFGGGINSEFGLHLFGEASDRELFSDGRLLSLRFDTFYDDTKAEISRGLASLQYTDSDLFIPDLSFSEDLHFQKTDLSTQEFNLDRVSLTSLFYQSIDTTSWALGHTVLAEHLQDVTPGAILDPDLDTGDVLLSFLKGNFGFDQRDNQLNPRSGYSMKVDWALAHDAIGSESSYFRLDSRGTAMLPFTIRSANFGLATGLRIGSAWSMDNNSEIPITQRFYLGGRTTVRGFRENSLGPRGPDSAVIGGDLLTLLNTELRYFPSENISVHGFLDSGTVFLRSLGVNSDDIRFGTGVGIRYLSPIGPVGFDVGAPLDERAGEPSVRFHFSIGSTF